MTAQIFPEPFYSKLLNNGERIGISEDGKFEILPPESYCSRIKRFFTFQQDPNIDNVHSRFKTLVDQATAGAGDDFSTLSDEIHSHGKSKYLFLEANLCSLRDKFDRVGQSNCFSKLILKVINAVRHLFGYAPIELKTYANISIEYIQDDAPWASGYFKKTEREFNFGWDPGNLGNPFAQAGLNWSPKDGETCRFSADSQATTIELQKLENRLEDFYSLKQVHKDFTDLPRGMGTRQILANLEVRFDHDKGCFLAAINNPRWRANHSPFPRQDGKQLIARVFQRHLNELSDDAKSFRFFVTAKDAAGQEEKHELKWVAKLTEQAPIMLDKGSASLELKPGIQYSFFDEEQHLVSSFTITDKNLS